jgi:WXG100 family type VII secretion target
MSEILITPSQIRATADQVRQHAKTVQTAIDAVDTAIKACGPSKFEGNRADTLRARYSRNRQKFYNFKPMLEKFATLLQEAANRFEAADKVQ